MSASNGGEFSKLRVLYNGPVGAHRLIGIATKTKYGRHKRGDILWVHRADVAANTEMFTSLGSELSAAGTLPRSPEDVRRPVLDVQPVPLSNEAERATESMHRERAQRTLEAVLPTPMPDGETPLATLRLKALVLSALMEAGIETVQGLRALIGDEEAMLAIDGIGQKTLDDLKARLETIE